MSHKERRPRCAGSHQPPAFLVVVESKSTGVRFEHGECAVCGHAFNLVTDGTIYPHGDDGCQPNLWRPSCWRKQRRVQECYREVCRTERARLVLHPATSTRCGDDPTP